MPRRTASCRRRNLHRSASSLPAPRTKSRTRSIFANNFSGVSSELIDELQDALKRLPIDQKSRSEIHELTDTLRGNLDKVMQHGKRADAIVKNMLLHPREGSGEHRVVDINALVEESLNLAYHGVLAPKSRTSTSRCSDHLTRWRARPIYSRRTLHARCSILFAMIFTLQRSVVRKQTAATTNLPLLPLPKALATVSR